MGHEDSGTREDLARYRMETAKNNLADAKLLYDAQSYKSANNRAYYAIFHAINAIHALDGAGFKRHKDVIGTFNKLYVKSGIFPRELGRQIAVGMDIRHASDYDDFYDSTQEETLSLLSVAAEFISAVERYCESRIKQNSSEAEGEPT